MNRLVNFAAVPAALFAVACGGRQTVASRSAAAYRDAIAHGKTVTAGGHSHAGHGDQTSTTATEEHGAVAMDHSSMSGMQHGSMAGMNHSEMQHDSAQSMANMRGMEHGSMSGMDHSKMQHGSSQSMANMPGMQHGSMAGMDHSKMQHGSSQSMANMPGMQHGSMAGMDHSQMQHGSAQSMANMPGMHHGATPTPTVPPAPATSSGIAQLNPAATLQQDSFDRPAPIAVSEATKSGAAMGDHTMAMPEKSAPQQLPPHRHPPSGDQR